MGTSNSDGSETAVIDTEVTIGGAGNDTITTEGSFTIAIDANAMVLGDELIVRVKKKVRSVGTLRLLSENFYSGVQTEKVIESVPTFSSNELSFTIEQIAGTGRAFPWEISEL